MNVTVYQSQLDRLMKPFWDSVFSSLEYHDEWSSTPNVLKWRGFVGKTEKDPMIILGKVADFESPEVWYYYKDYFEGGESMFNTSQLEFLNAMKRYVKNTYGINIETLV